MGSRVAMLVAVAALQSGCYNYLPLGGSHLVPSTYLAVTLTETGSEDLAQYVGPSVLIVRGRFLSTTERGLSLSVLSVETRRGTVFEWKGENVVVPSEFVRSLEERQVAPGKTVLLAGAGLAGFFVAYAAFGPGASGTTPAGGGGGGSPR